METAINTTTAVQVTEEEVNKSTLNTEMEEVKMATRENNGPDAVVQTEALDTTGNEEPETITDFRVIDEVAVTRIRELVDLAVASFFYMSNPKRIATLEAALAIPVSDDKSFQQFFNHAEKDLLAAAYRDARENKGMPAEVTNAQVMAEAKKRYEAKHGKRALVNEEFEA
ncbi:MAG: hypothetical protein IPQ16_12035 [Geobacteraceae bacterium]|nr:hypothetical protein [Geobacteraceae bacterium]